MCDMNNEDFIVYEKYMNNEGYMIYLKYVIELMKAISFI